MPAWLIGDPGRMPFVGHLRFAARVGDAWISLAGRVHPGDVEEGWRAARELAAALDPIEERTRGLGAGRFALVRAAWALLGEAPRDGLGPAGGADVSVLMVAGDPGGVAVTGVGLTGVWGLEAGGQWTPLASEGHPLLSRAGLPSTPPGVLELERAIEVVVGCPHPMEPELPAPSVMAERCGVRR